MKKFVLFAAMFLTLAAPGLAWSEGAAGGTTPPPSAAGVPPSQAMMMMGEGKNFEEHKAMMLQRMNEHVTAMQKRISCVEAAKKPEEVRNCMPKFEGRLMPGGMPPPGQQPPPQATPQTAPPGDHK